MFFDQVKKKLRSHQILWSVISLAVVVLCVVLVISTGFSSEAQWRLGLRMSSDVGIPLPNWLVSVIFVMMGLLFAYLLVSNSKEIFTNSDFNKFLESARSLGDLATIERTLEQLPKSTLTKGGELRYGPDLFFYMKGAEVTLIPTGTITAVQPVKQTGKNAEFYVRIHYKDQTLKVYTKEKDLMPLVNEIISCVKSARSNV